MTDERLKEIRESNAKQRRFMEWNCRGQYINERHVVTHVEELIAEIERLRADAARLDWLCGGGMLQYAGYMTCKGNGQSPRDAIDAAAEEAEEATWLAK